MSPVKVCRTWQNHYYEEWLAKLWMTKWTSEGCPLLTSPVKVCWTWLICVNKPCFYWWELSSQLYHHSLPPFLVVPSSDGTCIGDISQRQPCSEYLQLVLVLSLVSPCIKWILADVNKKQHLKYILLFTCMYIYLQLMPQILYWVCSHLGFLEGSFTWLCFAQWKRLVRVIVLHKAMPIIIGPVWKWNKALFQDLHIQFCIHDPIKDTESCCTLVADSTPGVEFDGVPWAWFITGLLILALLPAAEPPVRFELYRGFIRPHVCKQLEIMLVRG